MSINILDPSVASKIAAGEVVERPSSVVKELVENSIDAKSSAITVEILDGGMRQIRVSDNGIGLSFDDAKTAFYRHATSKIKTSQDIDHIESLGFRGEALYSICAVSMVELTTRQQENESGVYVRAEGGEFFEHREAGSPVGTSIIVKNLFYNTPARLKFLKKYAFEAAYCADIVMRLMMAHPDIAFRFVNNGRTLYQTMGDGKLDNVLLSIYGKELLGELLSVSFSDDEQTISGVIGTERVARSNRTWQSFFVNGRYIKSRELAEAIQKAYGVRLMQHKYPVCALNINIKPELIDVNVSPNKLEIRFNDQQKVVNVLSTAIMNALDDVTYERKDSINIVGPSNLRNQASITKTQDSIKEIALRFGFDEKREKLYKAEESHGLNRDYSDEIRDIGLSGFLNDVKQAEIIPQGSDDSDFVDEIIVQDDNDSYSIIGEAFKTYIVLEKFDELWLIDKHAAHERIIYDNLIDSVKAGNVMSQQLLSPEIITLSPKEYAAVMSQIDELRNIGFEIEQFGLNTLRISALPFVLGQVSMNDFFIQISSQGISQDSVELKSEKLARLACRSAIKAGNSSNKLEMDEIVSLVLAKGENLTCPHGRPVVFRLSRRTLEKAFGRVVG